MKKTICMIVSCLLVFCFATTAFADENNTTMLTSNNSVMPMSDYIDYLDEYEGYFRLQMRRDFSLSSTKDLKLGIGLTAKTNVKIYRDGIIDVKIFEKNVPGDSQAHIYDINNCSAGKYYIVFENGDEYCHGYYNITAW